MRRTVLLPGQQDPKNPRKIVVSWVEPCAYFGERTAHSLTLTYEGGIRWYTARIRPTQLGAPTPEQVAQAEADFDAVVRPWVMHGTVPTPDPEEG